jgi:acetate CoA/acetoacetate CoA-transferase alpha subunit
LTTTGIGTVVADGKRTIEIDGEQFLLELPVTADFALIFCYRTDYSGNLDYSLTARNFNPIMAMAGKTVIAEPNEVVPVGVIPPDDVITPHIVVDYFIERGLSHG